MGLIDKIKARFLEYGLAIGVRKAAIFGTTVLAGLLANPKIAPYLAGLGISINMTDFQKGLTTVLASAAAFAADFVLHHSFSKVSPETEAAVLAQKTSTPQ